MWQFFQQLSENPILTPTILSSIFHPHIDPSLSLPFIFSTPWTSPPLPPSISNLPHATYTSAVPINTRARSHCAALWPPPCLSEHPRPAASVLVCHRALSRRSVIDGPWCAALTRRAAALSRMVWGSIDYDASRDRGESGLSWWWQGRQKRPRLWMRCC